MSEYKNLLPCPFCGASGDGIGLHQRLYDMAWRVACKCGADGPYVSDENPSTRTQEVAIEVWNRRAGTHASGLLRAAEIASGRIEEGCDCKGCYYVKLAVDAIRAEAIRKLKV